MLHKPLATKTKFRSDLEPLTLVWQPQSSSAGLKLHTGVHKAGRLRELQIQHYAGKRGQWANPTLAVQDAQSLQGRPNWRKFSAKHTSSKRKPHQATALALERQRRRIPRSNLRLERLPGASMASLQACGCTSAGGAVLPKSRLD